MINIIFTPIFLLAICLIFNNIDGKSLDEESQAKENKNNARQEATGFLKSNLTTSTIKEESQTLQLDGQGLRCPSQVSSLRLNHVLPHRHISDDWFLSSTYSPGSTKGGYETLKQAYVITQFPLSSGRSIIDYINPRHSKHGPTKEVDTIILSPVDPDKTKLGVVLQEYVCSGHSAHFILPCKENTLIKWAAPRFYDANIEGESSWNERSINILVETCENNCVSSGQIRRIREIINLNSPSYAYKIDINYVISRAEATSSNRHGHEHVSDDGVIENIEEIRRHLCLSVPW